MRFDNLLDFINRDMRMAHIYQPVMLRVLLDNGGQASREDIARALLNQDRSQLEYYSAITTNMVGRVLRNHGIVERNGSNYRLPGYEKLTREQVQQPQGGLRYKTCRICGETWRCDLAASAASRRLH
jgi:ATP adenylyltransferase